MSESAIVIIGHVCIDHNKSEHATYTSWGSSVLYMSRYYQKHTGISPVAIASYGPDMLEYLPDITILPQQPDRSSTLMYENDTSSGKRTQRCYNLQSALPPKTSPEIIEAVGKADILIVATLLPNYSATYLHELLDHAKEGSLKVLCPQGYFRHVNPEGKVEPHDFEEAADIVPAFDLVMYSEEDYLGAMSLAQQWKMKSVHTKVIVTQGANGASIVEAARIIQIPTHPIPPEEIVDSVGCGDTFAATVTEAYYRTNDLHEAILEGHKAAAGKLLAVVTVK